MSDGNSAMRDLTTFEVQKTFHTPTKRRRAGQFASRIDNSWMNSDNDEIKLADSINIEEESLKRVSIDISASTWISFWTGMKERNEHNRMQSNQRNIQFYIQTIAEKG